MPRLRPNPALTTPPIAVLSRTLWQLLISALLVVACWAIWHGGGTSANWPAWLLISPAVALMVAYRHRLSMAWQTA